LLTIANAISIHTYKMPVPTISRHLDPTNASCYLKNDLAIG